MDKKVIALVMIILGLFIIIAPWLGTAFINAIAGIIILVLGLGLLISGITNIKNSKAMGLLDIILGIIALILGIGFIFKIGLFAGVMGVLIWIVGILLTITGILGIVTKSGGSRWNGTIALIIGIIYVIVGNFVSDEPWILGLLLGIWLLINGILILFVEE